MSSMWKASGFILRISAEALALVALLGALAWGGTIRDDFGRQVTFEVPPRRVVSLAPSLTKAMVLLGLGDRLVGVSTYCNLPQVSSLPRVGSVTDFNLEAVLQLKPDLVMATPLIPSVQVERLEEFGVKTVIFRAPEDFEELCQQFLRLSRIFEKEAEAERILAEARGRLEEIERRLSGKARPTVVLQIGANPLWVAGRESFLGQAVELAGGRNPIEGEGGPISRELVVKLNPDVILIVDMGIVGEREVENWKALPVIRAVREGRIYVVKSDLYCSPTPLSFVQGVEELWRLLHGEERGSIERDELPHMREALGTR